MNGSNGTISTLSFFGQLIYKSLSSIIQSEEAKHFVMWQKMQRVKISGGSLCTSCNALLGSESWPRPLRCLLCKWRSRCMMVSSCNCWLPRRWRAHCLSLTYKEKTQVSAILILFGLTFYHGGLVIIFSLTGCNVMCTTQPQHIFSTHTH